MINLYEQSQTSEFGQKRMVPNSIKSFAKIQSNHIRLFLKLVWQSVKRSGGWTHRPKYKLVSK